VLSHENIVTAAVSITSYLENTADDVILNVLPLSFDYGLYQVLMAFLVGGTVVLERSFAYPALTLAMLVRERVTGFPIVPTIAAMLLQYNLDSYEFSALRYITSTGAALPSAHIAMLRSKLPSVRLYSMYGITESKRVAYLSPDEIDERPTSVGKAMPNLEVFVCDESGRLVEMGTGELVVRGGAVMQGYWGRPEDTARVLRSGRFPGERLLYTGDIFRIDDEGYLYFVSRTDDMIKSRGEKVSPREVENVLHDLPGVIEAAVVGVPDELLGQAIKAYVRVDPTVGLSVRDIASHCAQRLEDFMVPKLVEFVQAMPNTMSGKVDRRELAGRVAS
jgi:long-chain acyl-CoA synthetase